MAYKVGEKEIPAFVFTDNPLEAKTTAEKIFNWKSTQYGQPKMNAENPVHAWNETAGDIRIDNGDTQLYYNGKAGDIMELRPDIGESRMVYGDTYDFGEDYVNKYLKNTSPIIQKLALRLSNLTHPITVFSPDIPFYGMP